MSFPFLVTYLSLIFQSSPNFVSSLPNNLIPRSASKSSLETAPRYHPARFFPDNVEDYIVRDANGSACIILQSAIQISFPYYDANHTVKILN